ncbi:uncharacterized protein UTRI_06712_B [Ustilago trichophora]|uniref:BTB domain-containing protein n=1 Tax=Ustilago trichophora TaxID=86804 RepID=A0A5C3EQE8_9BASI|nr:uncharacterized protein UTRI_06712_B [Ustilago trichophora]
MATSSTNDGASEADRIATASSTTNSAMQTSTEAATAVAPSPSANSSPSDQAATPANQPPSNSATTTTAIQSQATVSPAQNALPLSSSSNTQSANASTSTSTSTSTSIPSTTVSMLPRSTASSSAASSSTPASTSSSGAATPTTRQYATTNSTHLASPARASSSLAQYHTHLATRGRRISQHNPTSRSRFTSAAAAMASTDNSNTVPSIFGYYSHDASAVNPANPANASTQRDYGPGWRVVQATNQPAASRSTGPVRIDRSFLASPNSSPRVGSLSFYPHAAHSRPSWDNSTTLGTAYRPTQSQQDHTAAAYSTSTSNSTDSSFLPSSLPAPQPTFEETTTISFTWTIRDLHLLREEVELTPPPSEGGRSVSAGAGKSDVWTNQPVFGDNKWKLELVRTTRPLADDEQDTPANLHNNTEDEAMSESVSSVEPIAVQSSSGNSDADSSPRHTITILSVYLTALVLDYTHANVEIPSSIMIGLRPLRAAVGRRGAENAGYLWRRFYDYTFQKEADLFTCHDLPSVSEMLQDVNVARDDAIALTIQLGLGPGYSRGRSGLLDDNAVTRIPVEVDGHHLVPRAVINSLGGLLDDANTGDVRIIVRERGMMLPSDSASMSDLAHLDTTLTENHGRVVPYPIGSSCPTASGEPTDVEADALNSIEDDPDRIFVRDRVLWAHASVLKSRSDYFQTMLASDFSEGIGRSFGADGSGSAVNRNVRTLRIPDADFVTAYWFLHYLYTDDIQFADKEDVRSAVLDEEWAKGADLGYLTAGSSSGETGAEGFRSNMLIDWTPISQLKAFDDLEIEETEASRANSGYSMSRGQPSSSSVDRHDVSGSFVLQGSSMRAAAPTSNVTTSGSLRQRISLGGIGDASSSVNPSSNASTAISAPTSPSVSAAPPTTATTSNKHNTTDETWSTTPLSAEPCRTSCFDPHFHPTSHPGPASALSIFKLSHRYHMQDLSKLASLHIIATLTPHSAFPMLLATSMYDELHTRIKTYVYQHWHLVSHTKEFERCCDEVSVGLWGSDAGKTMRAFVRSLISPLRAFQS